MGSSPADSTTDATRVGPATGLPEIRKRKNTEDDSTASDVRRYRASRACQYCRTRKVRCDVLRNESGCTNCRLDNRECVLVASRRGKTGRWLDNEADASQNPPSPQPSDNICDLTSNAAAHDYSFSPQTMPQLTEAAAPGDVPVFVTFDGNNEDTDTGDQVADDRLLTDRTSSDSYDVATLVSHDSISSTLQHHPSPGGVATLPSFIAPFRNKIPPEDLEFLARKGALSVPQTKLRIEILKGYAFSVHPFMPMLDLKPFVEAVTSERKDIRISLLLFQAVMFAGLSSLEQHVLDRLGFENAKQAREVFFNRVRLLYEFDVEGDGAAVFQSLLLMSSWYSKWNEWRDNSYWAAQAVVVAQNLGLHREPTLACGSHKIQRRRRRMWWSLYIRDRMLALGTRRPMRIRDDDFDVAMLTLQDFDTEPLIELGHNQLGALDGEEQKYTALMCIELAKLCRCIGHVLSTQYTTLSTKPAVPHTTMVVPRRDGQRPTELEKCDAEIDEWARRLPENVCRASSTSQQLNSSSCSEVHWAMLNLAHLTLVNVLHRTQALQPLSKVAEVQAIRSASKSKVKDAARKVTKIVQTMLQRNQVRFLGLNGITALLAACLSHMGDIQNGNDDVRDASILRLDQSMQVLHYMRGMYATADAALTFLSSVVKKARLPVTLPALYCISASPDCRVRPLTLPNEHGGFGEVLPFRHNVGATTCTPSKALEMNFPADQVPSDPHPMTQMHSAAWSGIDRHASDNTASAPLHSSLDMYNDGCTRDNKPFRFDDLLFENDINPDDPLSFEPTLYSYDFFFDSFGFLDGLSQDMV